MLCVVGDIKYQCIYSYPGLVSMVVCRMFHFFLKLKVKFCSTFGIIILFIYLFSDRDSVAVYKQLYM